MRGSTDPRISTFRVDTCSAVFSCVQLCPAVCELPVYPRDALSSPLRRATDRRLRHARRVPGGCEQDVAPATRLHVPVKGPDTRRLRRPLLRPLRLRTLRPPPAEGRRVWARPGIRRRRGDRLLERGRRPARPRPLPLFARRRVPHLRVEGRGTDGERTREDPRWPECEFISKGSERGREGPRGAERGREGPRGAERGREGPG